jgi:hypothetical protein
VVPQKERLAKREAAEAAAEGLVPTR